MQLISLKVTNGINLIREITFKEGINIITNKGVDGNQIGKSTALRAVNFCLGSDGNSLWKDPDSGITNQKIYRLVTDEQVEFSLSMKVNGINYEIRRRIEQQVQKNKTILKRYSWINKTQYNSVDKFKEGISKIFGYEVEKPSYNSVKNRFTRLDKSSSNKIYKYQNTFTSDDQYRLIYSHLFGFEGHEDLADEIGFSKEIAEHKIRIKSLLNSSEKNTYQKKLDLLDDEIKELSSKEETYDITGIQNKAIEDLREHRILIASLSNEIAGYETKILYNERTIDNYKTKVAFIDIAAIKAIYDEAVTLIPNVTKTLEDSINFHNSVFAKKAEYVEKQTEIIKLELASKKKLLDLNLNNEKQLLKAISNESHLSGFILIERAIQEKKEERGRISYVLDEVATIEEDILELNKKILKSRKKIEEFMAELNENIHTFNKASEEISKKIFKSFSIQLRANITPEGPLDFHVINNDKVTGDGAPRAASMAFDMAMVQYVKLSKAKLPAFTLQDYLEAADEEKLTTLFKLSNELNIQTVISILNDKLNLLSDKFLEKNVILSLSTTNKFFKI